MGWKDAREKTREAWRREIAARCQDPSIRVLALKGTMRALDEMFATADNKSAVVSGIATIPTLDELASRVGTGRVSLADQAREILKKAVEAGKLDDKLADLLVKPTKETIARARAMLEE